MEKHPFSIRLSSNRAESTGAVRSWISPYLSFNRCNCVYSCAAISLFSKAAPDLSGCFDVSSHIIQHSVHPRSLSSLRLPQNSICRRACKLHCNSGQQRPDWNRRLASFTATRCGAISFDDSSAAGSVFLRSAFV